MMILLIAIILGIVGIDQLTKWLTVINLEEYETIPLWENVFHFTFYKNDGAAFGMLDDHRWGFMTFSTVAIIGICVYLFAFRPKSRYLQITLAMMVGGGIGNMIDRVLLGYVIDFIDFCAFPNLWKWVFNIADSCVCVGTFMLSLWLIIDTVKAYKLEKAQKEREE